MKLPMSNCQTVGELIIELQKFPEFLPIVAAYESGVRAGEYFSIQPRLDNLKNQDTSGDPEFYGAQECVVLK